MIGANGGAVEAGRSNSHAGRARRLLEGRLGDHFAAVDDLRSTYREFRADSNRQFGDVRAEVEHSRTDMARQFGELRQEVRRLDGKIDTQFRWLAGMQVTTILAIGSAVVGLYFK